MKKLNVIFAAIVLAGAGASGAGELSVGVTPTGLGGKLGSEVSASTLVRGQVAEIFGNRAGKLEHVGVGLKFEADHVYTSLGVKPWVGLGLAQTKHQQSSNCWTRPGVDCTGDKWSPALTLGVSRQMTDKVSVEALARHFPSFAGGSQTTAGLGLKVKF